MISIIIPTLNEEKYLPLTLNEIKKQSFNDFEVIVSDAGSSDRTIELAETAGCRIVDGGDSPAKGRNEGAKIANGDLLLFMDADNIIIPDNFLKELKEKFEMRNLDCAAFPIFIEGNKLDRFFYGIYNFWVELSQNFLPHAFNSMIIQKGLHQKIKGFDEDIKLAEDHAYIRKAAKVGKFGFIRTQPMITSNRRFKKEGKLKGYLKYIFAGLYMALFGNIKNDIFKYRFGYEKDKDRK